MKPTIQRRVGRLLRWIAAGILLLMVLFAVEDRLAKPSLTGFDPARMGRLEASMWRSYYEHRWVALALDGLRVSCGEYGYSWWDGLRTSALAARAALHFRGATDDPRCLPLLRRYYGIIREGMSLGFDADEAARLELEWWRQRRRKLAPTVYAETIAANVALVYGRDPSGLLSPSLKRAEAMHYRDRYGRGEGKMTEENWAEVERQLVEAYSEMKAILAEPGETLARGN